MHFKVNVKKNRFVISIWCMKDPLGKGSLVNPGARSVSLTHWILAVQPDGVAEVLMKEEIKEWMQANDHIDSHSEPHTVCPSTSSTDAALSFVLDFLCTLCA